MITWIFRLAYRVLFGKDFLWWQQPMQPQGRPMQQDTNCVFTCTYGMVRFRTFLNHNRRGNPYYKFAVNRLADKDGRKLVNSFFLDDLNDLELGIRRIRGWIRDSEATS